MELYQEKIFMDMSVDELDGLNGGGVGGFVIGYMAGTVVGYIGLAGIAAAGGTREQGAQVLLASITTFSSLGALCTGPV